MLVIISPGEANNMPASNGMWFSFSPFSSLKLLLDLLSQANLHLENFNFGKALQILTKIINNNELPFGVVIQEIYATRAQCYHRLHMYLEARVSYIIAVYLFLITLQQDCKTIIDYDKPAHLVAEAYMRYRIKQKKKKKNS